ncbi:hypothetical protein KY084_01405 [Stakelama sp. CBK3Z-3]|uniref:Alpha/beta hydrolase n=2 Tax=Stakelama flava TaxID=2860338 RepID=A0ABS6XH39_9SPHN|nr:hypothetical protein [Stakelama flava]MBW4329534.1 hypothetical protein [Stakelama flava]
MLRFGPDTGPVVLIALPLLEEANRTRALVITVLRMLAGHGIGGALPDLPGTGESLLPTSEMTLEGLRSAFAAAALSLGSRPVHVASIRSGSLIDVQAKAAGRWRLAPQSGPGLLRDLHRVQRVSELGDTKADALVFAGNRLAPALIEALDQPPAATPGPLREVAIQSGQPDPVIEGPALWRRSEPGNDAAFAERIADDIARWIASCDA